MKKIVGSILLAAMLAACLGGCGGAEQELPDVPDAEQSSDTPDTEQPSGTLDAEYQSDISIDPDLSFESSPDTGTSSVMFLCLLRDFFVLGDVS